MRGAAYQVSCKRLSKQSKFSALQTIQIASRHVEDVNLMSDKNRPPLSSRLERRNRPNKDGHSAGC